MPHSFLRQVTIAAALLLIAGAAAANTVVTLGSVSQISGPQDLDLEGNIVYAINFSPNDPVRTVSGVAFLPDTQAVPGASFVGPQNVAPWDSKPEFGDSADADELEEIFADIRWANAANSQTLKATLAVTAGEEYKLQLLISGNRVEDRKWDIRVNGQNAVDEITSLGASPGNSYSQNRATLFAYQFSASSASLVVEMGTLFGANEGGDRNPIWQGLTLERVFIPPTPDDVLLEPSQFFPNQTARVGQLRAVDRKSSTVQHAFALVAGAGGADNVKFTISGNQLLPQPFNFSAQAPGTMYSIRVRATDTSNSARFFEKPLTLAISTPHAPTALGLDASSVSLAAQAGMVAAQLTATDQDSFDVHTFSLVAGAGSTHNALFTVVGRELRFAQLLPAGQVQVQVRLRATDLAGLSVERALTLPVIEPKPRINEFLAGNATGLLDENLQRQDWIELYNEQPQTVDLTGWYLTDDRDNLTKWKFPARPIGPNGYLLIFADGTTTPPGPTGNLHANFSLDQAGEWFALVKPDGTTIASEFDPPEQYPNVTYGLGQNGEQRGYLATPTPGAANSAVATSAKNEVTFSQAHGFFSASFPLTLMASVPGSTIRYTLDGSRPTANTGIVYAGPITITPDTTAAKKGSRLVRAIALSPQSAYSPVTTNTYLFINGTTNPATDGVITQSTLVASIRDHATYGPLIDDALLALPTVSVILPSGLSTSENAASVELFDSQHLEAGFQIDCGINATGTTSLGSPKLSMAAKFRNQYGQPRLRYPVFADYPYRPDQAATEFKELRLRSGSHDTFYWLAKRENPPVPYGGGPPVTRSGDAQYIRNIWIEEMQARMGQPAKHGRMVQLYLNGSYHGLYHIQEHADDDFMASYYPGSSDDYHFTAGATAGSNHGGGDTWSAVWGQLKASLTNYAEAQRWIDMTNLADYMLLSFYAGNDWDWFVQHNWSAAGPKTRDQGGWKFFEQDSDICLQDVKANCTDQGVPDGIFASLMSRHADFKVLFRDRAYKHCFNDGVLTPAKVASSYNARANEIFTALVSETARWQPSSSVGALPWDRDGEWTVEWNYFKNTYFPQRTDELLRQLRARAGWYPVDAPVFNQRGGSVLPGFDVILTAPAGATIYYTTDGSDPRLAGGTPSPSARSFSATTANTTLSPPGALWSYLDNGSDQGTAWRGTGFVVTGWESGSAQLGYGESDETTEVGFIDTDPIAAGDQKNLTTYFRRSFEVATPSSITGLVVRLKCDDGAVVYLNGQEIVRSNLPAGSVTFQTLATSAGDDGQTFRDFPLGNGQFALVGGPNFLAVEIHQADPTSSDISFDLELIGVAQAAPQWLVINGPTVVRSRALLGSEWSAINDASFVLPGTVPAALANFCVTEIHYHPSEPTATEFLEFQNTSAAFIDAAGVRISGGVEFTFPLGTVLAPGERIVVVNNAAFLDATHRNTNSPYYHAGIRVAGVWSGSLSNSGETITLIHPDQSALFGVQYADGGAWPGRPDGRGSSLELVDPSAVPAGSTAAKTAWLGTAGNWRATSEYHGTPGWAGTGPDNRVVVNEVLTASLPPQTDAIELLNTSAGTISLGGWFLSDDADNYKKFRFPATAALAADGYLVMVESDFNNPANPASLVSFALNSGGDDVYLIEADPAGNLLRFVDHAELSGATDGVSIGRVPNGTGSFELLEAVTLGAANEASFAEYAAWVATVFPPNSPSELTNPGADPDGDGLSNLGELGFGLLPTQLDRSPLQLVAAGNGEIAFQYPVRTGLSSLSVVVTVSTDLENWDATGLQVETLSRLPQGNGTELVTARLKPSAAGWRFVRVEVRL